MAVRTVISLCVSSTIKQSHCQRNYFNCSYRAAGVIVGPFIIILVYVKRNKGLIDMTKDNSPFLYPAARGPGRPRSDNAQTDTGQAGVLATRMLYHYVDDFKAIAKSRNSTPSAVLREMVKEFVDQHKSSAA